MATLQDMEFFLIVQKYLKEDKTIDIGYYEYFNCSLLSKSQGY